MEQNIKRQFIYPLPIYQLINLQKIPISRNNHSTHSTENMDKSRIKDYYKLFKDKKNLIENYQKMYNRIILLKKQQDKQLKKKVIQEKKSMYLSKYKSNQNEIIFNKSDYTNHIMKNKKISNYFLIHQEFQQISKKKADYIKKQTEIHQKMIQERKRKQFQRKLKTAQQIKRQKTEAKQNVQKFFMDKHQQISQLIEQKIIKQQKQCRQVEKKLQKLENFEKQMIKDKKSFLNQLKLNKILI